MSFTQITVTGTFLREDDIPAQGRIRFHPTAPMRDVHGAGADHRRVRAVLPDQPVAHRPGETIDLAAIAPAIPQSLGLTYALQSSVDGTGTGISVGAAGGNAGVGSAASSTAAVGGGLPAGAISLSSTSAFVPGQGSPSGGVGNATGAGMAGGGGGGGSTTLGGSGGGAGSVGGAGGATGVSGASGTAAGTAGGLQQPTQAPVAAVAVAAPQGPALADRWCRRLRAGRYRMDALTRTRTGP